MTGELEERFNKVALAIKNSTRPKDAKPMDGLKLYGFYKQATSGDCSLSDEPWQVQVEKYSKWKAWYKIRGMSRERAMTGYINAAQEFL